ncbi:GMC family oxidoreductase [Thiocystis violacea]|uniref:GMC family oxidoreductase n=1 Tax=Thiocystis violacea TaxID=13725 RepID=UPI001902D7BC|nr:GMC oxidoreductase [Thiocystis violacea]MBK1724583.1 glucose-methanol-choline oxidoreductase [Thiocystis violacea]
MQPDDRRDAERSTDAEPRYDYIVVGSGAGGGPVAANLAEAGYRVLLMEAGGEPDSYDYQVPAFHPGASENPEMSWEFFVRHYADEDQQRRDSKYSPEHKGVFYPRAASIGGCTAHHAMILLYPHNTDWDGIARITGDQSWRAGRMRRYFQRIENCRYRTVQRLLQRILRWNPSRHGFDGWLETNKADPRMLLDDKAMVRLVERAASTALYENANPLTQLWHSLRGLLDPNDWGLIKGDRIGLRITPLTTARGRRLGARERIQAARRAFPDRLHVLTGALVTRVLLDANQRAVGVEYLRGEHLYAADPDRRDAAGLEPLTERVAREVILAGGAFNTPQLLQLSGIGPPELLERCGIPVRVALPGVGANLQDRYEVTVVHRMKAPFALLKGATMKGPDPGEEPDPQFRLWEQGRGPYTTNGAVTAIVRRSSAAEAGKGPSDLVLFGLLTNFRGYFPGYSREVRAATQYFSWAVLKGHTRNSAGTVHIRSKDPTERPEINFRYFDEGSAGAEEDLDAVVESVELIRRMMRGVSDLVAEETVPGPQVRTREEIRQFVKDEAWGHHASCTCKIGAADDPNAVLDSQFRVRGTQGLRVVDASVFPRAPGLFIVSAIYMIAEKACDDILAATRAG